MNEDVRLNAYFERIGFAGSIAPTLPTLEALHALQPAAIPFENISSLVGTPVPLDAPSLNQKLLVERRGGYCFELNLMFLRILRELGFDARGHLASVLWSGRPVDELVPDHMLITVDVGGTTYLADVGFGGLLLVAPLKLRTGIEQETALGNYRVTGEGPRLRLEFKHHGEDWRPVYAFTTEDVPDARYGEINDGLNADPAWFFHHHLLVERATPAGRHLLFDTRLTTITPGAERTILHLGTVEELRNILITTFGIGLGAIEGLDARLEALLARSAGAV